MFKKWAVLWSNKVYLSIWISLLLGALIVLKMVSLFLIYNENRIGGLILDDWMLNHIEPLNVSTLLFTITWVCIIGCLPIALRTPRRAMIVFVSIIMIGILRCLCLYVIQLSPPIGIIPLRDTFLESSFYGNKVLVKDLFFSGHTANLALLTFLIDFKFLKYILGVCTFIIACLLLKQHVHYTIDVLVAPFAAYLSYSLAYKTVDLLEEAVFRRSSVSTAIVRPL